MIQDAQSQGKTNCTGSAINQSIMQKELPAIHDIHAICLQLLK